MNEESGIPGFRALRTLAETALAHVYLAEAAASNTPIVLKVLRRELTSDREAVARFADEAKLSQEFSHPHVIRCFGAGQLPDGRHYLTAEFLEGEDLRGHLMAEGVLSPDALVRTLLPLCDALQYVHGRGVVHRDVRPENIFLVGGLEAFHPKLIDFGLAHFQGFRSAHTAAGVLLSKPEYIAPECIGGHRADARSDLYALGVVMYEALTGLPPFVDANRERVLHKHLRENPAGLPKASAHLLPIIERCLAKDPRSRFQTAGELTLALEEFGLLLSASAAHPFSTGEPPPPRVRPGQEQVGDVVGNHRLERLIADGGVGRVFVARHAQLGRQVALKLLKPEFVSRPDIVQRFFQEALAANQVRHEHIVEVYDFVSEPGEDGVGRSYCVMELLEGETLADHLDRGRLEIRRVLGIAAQLCDALEATHRVGVVHRDIKPENILLTRRAGVGDFVKLLDFGIAKLKSGSNERPIFQTAQGLVVGTPAYMSPEQASGHETDHRTDLYSLGTVLYEALAGRTPFFKGDFVQLAIEISKSPVPLLPDRTPAGEPIPSELAALVYWCLEKDPACRPQSAGDLREALLGLSAPSTTGPALEDAEALAFRPTRLRKLRGAFMGVGLLAATAGALYAVAPTTPSVRPSPEAEVAAPPIVETVLPVVDLAPAPLRVPAVAPAAPPVPVPSPAPELRPQVKPARTERVKRRPRKEPSPTLDPDGLMDPYAH
ncbi:MAG: serine/threonine-protein kinase [Myxococcaceae bacterium]